MLIERTLKSKIEDKLFAGKTILLNSPRQVGKTHLIRLILKHTGKDCLHMNADDPVVRNLMDTPNTEQIR